MMQTGLRVTPLHLTDKTSTGTARRGAKYDKMEMKYMGHCVPKLMQYGRRAPSPHLIANRTTDGGGSARQKENARRKTKLNPFNQ